MNIGNFYRLVFKRAWDLAFERARKFGFWVAPAGAVALALTWRFLPKHALLFARLIPYAAIASLVFFLLNLLWLLLIRAPYELFREKSEALDMALPKKMEAARRAEIHDVLASFLERGQALTVQLEHWRNNARGPRPPEFNDMDTGYQTIQWIEEVEGYLIRELDITYRARFGWGAYFPPVETMGLERDKIQYGLRARVTNLLVIVGEVRVQH